MAPRRRETGKSGDRTGQCGAEELTVVRRENRKCHAELTV